MTAQLNKIKNNLFSQKKIELSWSDNVFEFLKEKAFGNLENGGRGIGNIMEKYFINPLARYVYDNHLAEGAVLSIQNIEIDTNDIVRINVGD